MSTTEPAYQLLREENERLRARRGRCDKHKDMAGPSLYHDCCESERLRELCREQADENERLRERCERLEAACRDSLAQIERGDVGLPTSQFRALLLGRLRTAQVEPKEDTDG